MKSYYDVPLDEQRKLRKEFAHKYRSYRKGIFLGIALGLLMSGFGMYYFITGKVFGFAVSIILYIIVTGVLCIDENLAFNKWLRISKKLEK